MRRNIKDVIESAYKGEEISKEEKITCLVILDTFLMQEKQMKNLSYIVKWLKKKQSQSLKEIQL